ncbi:MAG: DUF1963 domain-containing protein [Rubrobacter sp.]|nr:DUF1963 domain-containing protein [Rubrobacter sp.]
MVGKYDIVEFVEADAPITEPVTKFGGQPVWLKEPEWPLSRELGEQMQFICQITLDPELLGVTPGRMAYLFVTGEEERGFMTATWDPDGGENAVIVQPGDANGAEIVPEAEGPSLYMLVNGRDWQEGAAPCEYAVDLEPGEDTEYVDEDERSQWSEEDYDSYCDALDGNKVGGTPVFIQSDEFPEGGPWRLLLQLDSMEVPFHVNFGDAGMGYAYISEDGESGKFLWQCY